jgi:hypothetical protein
MYRCSCTGTGNGTGTCMQSKALTIDMDACSQGAERKKAKIEFHGRCLLLVAFTFAKSEIMETKCDSDNFGNREAITTSAISSHEDPLKSRTVVSLMSRHWRTYIDAYKSILLWPGQ